MFELLRNIYLEQAKIEEILNEEDTQLTFYENFFKNDSYASVKELLTAEKTEVAIAIILTEHPELDTEFVRKTVEDNRVLFENEDNQTLQSLTDLLCDLQNAGYYKIIRNRFATGRKISLNDIFHENGALIILFNKLLESFKLEPEKFVSFMDLYENYLVSVTQSLVTCLVMSEVKEEYDAYKQRLGEIEEERGQKIRNRKQERFVNDLLKSDWNFKNILEPLRLAREYYEKKSREQKAKKKYNLKLRETYTTLEKEIQKAINEGTEIKNVDKLVSKIDNEAIRKQALIEIYLHNKAIYDKVNSEYERLIANSASKYQVLLAKYGVSPEDYDVRDIMNNSIEDLEEMLKVLSSLEIKLPNDILQITSISNLETLTNYQSLIEKGIITKGLLLNHHELLNPNSKIYESFMRNLSLIRERKINPLAFKQCEEVLATKHKTFKLSIETIYDYSLDNQIKTGLNYSFLSNKNLASSIDVLLELGYEKYLEEDIELLNYANHFKRLQVLKALNMPVSSKEELLSILTTEKFFIADDAIDSYIYNATQYNLPTKVTVISEAKKKNPDIERLTDYQETTRTYNVGGVIFSKNKTHRNLSLIATSGKTSDRLLYGLTKDTILTDLEFASVANVIAPSKNQQLSKK